MLKNAVANFGYFLGQEIFVKSLAKKRKGNLHEEAQRLLLSCVFGPYPSPPLFRQLIQAALLATQREEIVRESKCSEPFRPVTALGGGGGWMLDTAST